MKILKQSPSNHTNSNQINQNKTTPILENLECDSKTINIICVPGF